MIISRIVLKSDDIVTKLLSTRSKQFVEPFKFNPIKGIKISLKFKHINIVDI